MGEDAREKGGTILDTRKDEAVDEELDRLTSKRASQDRRQDPDEREELWKASVKAYNARRQEEHRAAWAAFHEGQAERHRRTLEELIARHEDEAAKLMDVELVED